MSDMIGKHRRYVQKRRNPLINCKLFHSRDQHAHETIDQHYAESVWLDNACAHEDANLVCASCSQPCGHAGHLRDTRLRDCLICGLADKTIQQRVLAEECSQDLDLNKVMRKYLYISRVFVTRESPLSG